MRVFVLVFVRSVRCWLYDCLEVVEMCCYCGVGVHVSENRFLNVGDCCVFVFVVSVG